MATKKNEPRNKPKTQPEFALGMENYKLLAIGFAIIILGFILMVGGKSESPDVFNPEIFTFNNRAFWVFI